MIGKLILLVEDNPDDEALTLRALRNSNIANEVVVVHDGAEAIDFLMGANRSDSQRLPELVLLDLNLPKVNGFEVLKRVRADSRTQTLPVVILTTSDEDRDLVESYKLGANSYVRKPVDFEEFRKAIKQLGMYWLVLNLGPPLNRM
jgi:two-component system, response regulator